jgi:hypothetical protein
MGVPIILYASVVHIGTGYHLRVADPGIPAFAQVFGTVLTFYGEPAVVEGESSEAAFLTNPTRCTPERQMAKATVESWENPGHPVSKEETVYPELTGCNVLQAFKPSLGFAPSATPEEGTTQADEPSSYTVNLELPQTSLFSELATPELENAAVTLPEGVSISPSAADGLRGCPSNGPEGINLLGPESEEVGPDRLTREAKGRCPDASTLGTVDVFTPVLPTRCGGKGQAECKTGESPAPLQGHVYVALPECGGGGGEPECNAAYAEGKGGPSGNGKLFGLYIEVQGSGVIVKLPGTVSANPATGQLTATFKENPQFPFSALQLHLKGGPRAPLANPQTCGSFMTTSVLSSWAGQDDPVPSPPFHVDWDGKGGACPASPFAPSFTAGTITPSAGGFSPFTMTLSRHDREQDLSGITLNTPPGMLGMLSQVPLCPEPQAGNGTCGEASLIGHTEVAAGPGPHPFWVGGKVYLTGPYKGAPFGLSIVTHAQAGPFNLGNVIVRAAIHVNPSSGALSVVSDPLPQIVDGVPLRIQTVHVTVDRPGFIFNPTNCSQMQVTGTITAAQGASANVANPFAVGGCKGLPFKPKFSARTSAKTSRLNGASLDVAVASAAGQANIASVHVELPGKLPSRLTTLRKACPEATFNANPGSCPSASVVGSATAQTPVLNDLLTGPAYIVSHGGEAFPDLVVMLQGQGVTIELTGATHISHGVTSSTFSSLPDAPISHFNLVLPKGPDSILGAVGSLCKKPLKMPTTITGQNGAQIKQSTRIAVSGCPKKHHKKQPVRRARRKKH